MVGEVYGLDLPPWLAPGEYELHAGLYTREGQQRLALPDGSTTAVVGTVEATAPVPLAGDEIPAVPIRLDAPMAEGLALYGQNPIPEQAVPGAVVDVTLYWQATAPAPRAYAVRFDLAASGEGSLGTGAEPAATWQRPPAGDGYPTTAWQPGAVVAGWVPLSLPPDLPPGRYDLLVTVMGGDRPAGDPVRLVTLQVEPGR